MRSCKMQQDVRHKHTTRFLSLNYRHFKWSRKSNTLGVCLQTITFELDDLNISHRQYLGQVWRSKSQNKVQDRRKMLQKWSMRRQVKAFEFWNHLGDWHVPLTHSQPVCDHFQQQKWKKCTNVSLCSINRQTKRTLQKRTLHYTCCFAKKFSYFNVFIITVWLWVSQHAFKLV